MLKLIFFYCSFFHRNLHSSHPFDLNISVSLRTVMSYSLKNERKLQFLLLLLLIKTENFQGTV